MKSTTRSRRAVSLVGIVAMIGAMLIAFAGPASAAGETITPTQTTNLIHNQSNPTTVVLPSALPATVFLAVTQCGNANTAGVPYTAAFALTVAFQDSCTGAADLTTVDATLGGLHLVGFPAGGLAAGSYTVNMKMLRTGIGAAAAQCIAGGIIPCQLTAATGTAVGEFLGPEAFAVSADITYKPPVSASISSVTTQVGNQAARAGDVINTAGSNWDVSAVPTAELCDVAGVVCDVAGVTGALASSAGGALSGGLTVAATAATGPRALKITNPSDSQTALVPVTILGTRTIALAVSSAGPGVTVGITGSGFDASAAVMVMKLDSTFGPLGPPAVGAATVNATGDVTGSFVVQADVGPPVAFITVFELATSQGDAKPFTVSALSCVPPGQVPGQPTTGGPDAAAGAAVGTSECSLTQTIALAVNGDVLGFSETASLITMSAITLNGQQQTSTGAINPVTVLDARGSLAGWTVIATMTDLNDGSPLNHHTIPATNMSWTPACALQNATSGDILDISTGAAAALDNTIARTLCTAVPGGGGGTFVGTAPLSLIVPASIFASNYTATLTLTVT